MTTAADPNAPLMRRAMRLLRRPFRGRRPEGTAPAPTSEPFVEPFVFTRLAPNVACRLDEIPSETTRGERHYLYRHFSSFWSGAYDVVEIGPFLGGTSRAIALGMLHNPRRRSGTVLRTFDRFRDYFDVPRLASFLAPMIASGALSAEDFESLGDRAPFLDIFRRIHDSQDYAECLVPSDDGVPDLPEQESSGHWMTLPAGFVTDSVFIDGCKSWYGTKAFMRRIASAAIPGSMFLFQDYGWYTCFWLGAFVQAFRDRFEPVGNVDNTYVFRLERPLTIAEIEARFPDSPEQCGATRLSELLEARIAEATERHDHFGRIRHTLHLAAALAYVDRKDEAREVLRSAERLPGIDPHRGVIEAAWRAPTYTPTGTVTLGR